MIHELKTWPRYFNAAEAGVKTFEIRRNDRKFELWDILRLQEYVPETATYTGNTVDVLVTYVLTEDDPLGISGRTVMGIRKELSR